MKEKDEENKKLIDTSQEQYIIEKEKNDDIGFKKLNNIKGEFEFDPGRMTSFEIELLNAVKKEEEEEFKKKKLKEKMKVKKKLFLSLSKDYLFFFILLMSSVFNFSYLYLVNTIIATIYIFYIENLSLQAKKVKYLCEVFSLGYSSYVLIFKFILLILINNNNQTLENHKTFFIDLGIIRLKDDKSDYYFVMTFLSEIYVIIISGYGTFITFYCRTLEEDVIKLKEIKMLTLRKTILLSYFFIVLYSLFNISILSLLYIIYIQFILLLHSISFTDKQVKSFYNCVVFFLTISLYIQIVFTNLLNIPTLKDNTLNIKTVPNSRKKYSIFTQIGIKNSYDDTGKDIALSFFSYLFGVVLIIILLFIHKLLKSDDNIKSEEEVEKIKTLKNMQEMSIIKNKDNNNNDNIIEVKKGNIIIDNSKLKNNNLNIKPIIKEDKEKDKKIKKKSTLFRINIVYRLIRFLMRHPNFNYEIERIISIIWVYYHRNYYSLGIYLVIFCSFFFVDITKNKCLILFILTPILLITIASYHIGNIDGIIEDLSLDDEVYYSKFAFGKYNYFFLEHLTGHIYYLTVIFLINSFYSKKKSDKKDDNNINIKNSELLENIIPKNEDNQNEQKNSILDDDLLYENKSEKSESDEESESNEILDDEEEEKKQNEAKKVKLEVQPERESMKSFGIRKLLIKKFFIHIDKITLIVMYFVSVYKVNLTHILLVLIFVLQIVIPKKIKYLYKILIIVFQIVYLVEFIIDLLKVHYFEKFNNHKNTLDLFIVYSGDLQKCDIEIFLYAVIYCLYFQHTTYKLKYIKRILEDDSITYENYINITFEKFPTLKSVINSINVIIVHIFFWCLAYLYIFFSCFYEINLIFGIKLLLFFISLYIFLITTHKKTMNSKIKIRTPKCQIFFNRIFLILCSVNTFCAFLFQFFCKAYNSYQANRNDNDKNKENFNYFNKDKENSNNFFIKNLPSIGFTFYEEENMYYNFIPHFLTSFICTLYVYHSEEILSNIDIQLTKSKTRLLKEKKTIKKSEKISDEKFKNIREEKNEFLQDKMYADKYYENDESIKSISRRLLRYYIIFLYTKVYWLLLFMSLGIIFSSYDLSFSILIYIIIFGFLFIKKFHRIVVKMKNYLSTNSYYISKVIRYSVVEKPLHYEYNKYYRSLTFKCCLFLSFLYLILLYFYGIFDLFQHGCSSENYRGCDSSNKPIIFPADESEEGDHNNLEAKIKGISFLIGIYINMKIENILKIALVHLVLSGLIVFDIYNQQLEEHYSILSNDLQKKLQKQINENNILEKYSEIADFNILIKIGLTLAGIDMSSSDNNNQKGRGNMRSYFRMSLKDKFLIKTDSTRNLFKVNDELQKKNTEEEIEYNLDEDAPENSFLKNSKIKKFIKMIKNSSDNEQKVSLGSS